MALSILVHFITVIKISFSPIFYPARIRISQNSPGLVVY